MIVRVSDVQLHWFEQRTRDMPSGVDWLSTAERQQVEAMQVPKRRNDWQLGRWTAKNAVAAWMKISTLAAIEIRPASSGAPVAFVKDERVRCAISLTHCGGIAACTVGPSESQLGCDLEAIEERSEAFGCDYFTTREQAVAAGLGREDRHAVLTLMWSLKESALKALQEGLRLDTRSVEVFLPNGGRWSEAKDWDRARVFTESGDGFDCLWRRDGKWVRTIACSDPFEVVEIRRVSVGMTAVH